MKNKYDPFSSWEEQTFNEYLEVLKTHGYISEFIYQPPSLALSRESHVASFHKFDTKVYTYDFHIFWTDKAVDVFISTDKKRTFFYAHDKQSRIDVKGGGFSVRPLKSDNTFPDRQAWVWQQHGVFVQKVLVTHKGDLLKKTFVPTSILKAEVYWVNTKKNKKGDSKFMFDTKTLQQFEEQQRLLIESINLKEENKIKRHEKRTKLQ